MKQYIMLIFTLLVVIIPVKIIPAECLTYYYDSDNDGYGNLDNSIPACSQPENYVLNSTDCDDGDSTIYPGAIELCDNKDNDCDNLIDTDDDIYSTNTYYRDSDNDGYGALDNSIQACPAPIGYLADNTDCDDTIGSINPGATEICDGIDNDCNPATADGAGAAWLDNACDGADTDECTEGSYICSGNAQACNDYTGDNIEVCDGLDNDCDDDYDEGFPDFDTDGYADCVDADVDGDGVDNTVDNCPLVANSCQEDVLDNDGVGDICDNCPDTANFEQTDVDGDGIGDVCANNTMLTPEGTGIELDFLTINSALGIVVIFDDVSSEGYTRINNIDTGTTLPDDFTLLGDYYDIETSTSYIGSIWVCVYYDDFDVDDEDSLYLFHRENDTWEDITTLLDTDDNTVCGETTSFSEYAVGEYNSEEEEDDDDPSKEHCFIATAAYGTPLAKDVKILSRFRDTHLLTNPLGQKFVSLYYRLSPPIAEYIKNSVYLKAITRGILKPVVWLVERLFTEDN